MLASGERARLTSCICHVWPRRWGEAVAAAESHREPSCSLCTPLRDSQVLPWSLVSFVEGSLPEAHPCDQISLGLQGQCASGAGLRGKKRGFACCAYCSFSLSSSSPFTKYFAHCTLSFGKPLCLQASQTGLFHGTDVVLQDYLHCAERAKPVSVLLPG